MEEGMVKKLVFSIALASFFFAQCAAEAVEEELARLANKGSPIKVFVKGFVNDSGQSQVLPQDFKKSFEAALLNRKSVSFELAESPETSDIQIEGVIKKYLYSKNDPITCYAGTPGVILDAVTTENYAEMSADFTVTDTKTGKILWNKPITNHVKQRMTAEKSIPLIYDKLSRTFLWKAFGKPR